MVYLVQFPERSRIRGRFKCWRTDETFGAHATLESAQRAAETVAPHWNWTSTCGSKTAWRIDNVPLWRLYPVEVDR